MLQPSKMLQEFKEAFNEAVKPPRSFRRLKRVRKHRADGTVYTKPDLLTRKLRQRHKTRAAKLQKKQHRRKYT